MRLRDVDTSQALSVGLVSVARRVVLGADDQTAALFRAAVHRLDDVDELLLVLEDPVELVVVAGAKVDHHVFVAKEEHDCARIVELYGSKVSPRTKDAGESPWLMMRYVPYIWLKSGTWSMSQT